MFSQFRQAVETFAPQQTRKGSQDAEGPSHAARSQSIDSQRPDSPGQLAESALSSLRKSFAPRSASPASAKSPITSPRTKSTLEERLRAVTHTLGEASNGTTPTSSRASPLPMKVAVDHPLSPTSTPLPDSPIVSPIVSPALEHVGHNLSLSVASLSDVTPAAEPASVSEQEPVEENAPNDTIPSVSTEEATHQSPPSASVGKEVEESAKDNAPPGQDVEDEIEEVIESLAIADESDPTTTKPVEPLSNEGTVMESNDDVSTVVAEEAEKEMEDVPTQHERSASPVFAIGTNVVAEIGKDVEASIAQNGRNTSPGVNTGTNVEELQERLKLVEQRFTDVSKSFKRLQAEKVAADSVLRELTPVETLQDSEGLRSYLQNIASKVEISQEEIKRLNEKLQGQDERLEELRDTHRLESHSQSEQIELLRKQLQETEALLSASQGSIAQGEDDLGKRQADINRLNQEMAKAKESAKEEEEKRVKAINLLKTVRQKLVKVEKEKEEAVKELAGVREKEASQKEKEDAEKAKLQKDIETVNAEREVAVAGLKAQFDKELLAMKERHEKEISAIRSQFELEAVTTKSVHTKVLNAKNFRISQLEASLETMSNDKNSYFDQLQIRQAEYESSQEQVEMLRNQNTEVQHQLREYADQVALLKEELLEFQRQQIQPTPSVSSEDTARLMSAVEAKYEAKLADLRRVLQNVEKERSESDIEWTRILREKKRETEELKQMLGSATKSKEQDEDVVGELRAQVARLQEEIQSNQTRISQLTTQLSQFQDVENSNQSKETELTSKIEQLERTVEEGKTRESQLRANVKTLREEIRKVQSSAALLDRQRNRGVGYWSSRNDGHPPEASNVSSPPSGRSSTSDPPAKEQEEVNLEYLRNVILQFLEHKEMRPSLVKVLSVILHFTPQETRRLIAKV
ncbi:hypothetical protein D9758_000209 [Tetrapyrgos nigripes]|uniref:GRIP domain-containing protein n=1 Tax=Tetrapyrgos nigripes TaxID=182062 RepID=A0A8H5LYX7_9AGAR|nr:hypothetical protein D9758_000209 [Tetrapyrgos nigripes]